tara:strand:- start:127 stop:327 length:201 start_codon:yes stop_codon:yes gene_type:complete
MKPFDDDDFYVIRGDQLNAIHDAAKRLYTEKTLTGDEMRDLAQKLYEFAITDQLANPKHHRLEYFY